MRRLGPIVALVVLVAAACAQQPDPRARIENATGVEKAKLALEFSEQQTKAADKAYQEGKDADASADLQDVAKYAPLAADVARETGKREKETEIAIRKLAKRLLDIKNSVAFEQRDEVQTTIDLVQKAHDALLDDMFKKKH